MTKQSRMKAQILTELKLRSLKLKTIANSLKRLIMHKQ